MVSNRQQPESIRRKNYAMRLAQLEAELAAAQAEWGSADSVARVRLDRKIEQFLQDAEYYEQRLRELDSQSSSPGVPENNIEKFLCTIDRKQARKKTADIRDKLRREGGAALFFLQRSKKQMGSYCVEEIFNLVMADQRCDGEMQGGYKRCPVDLNSAISQCDSRELLIRLAGHYDLDEIADSEELSKRLTERISSSIGEESATFIEIRGIDRLLEQENFFKWFIEQFWKSLIDQIKLTSSAHRSKVVITLIADSQIFHRCPSNYFCDDSAFDCYKMVELPLPDWTVDDVYSWLNPLRRQFKRTQWLSDEEIERFAEKICRDSEGIPKLICSSLREEFL